MRAAWLCLVLAACSAPERIASNAGDIRTLAESSRSRFVEHADTAGEAEQTAIIKKAAAISVDATRVDPTPPAWQGTLELALWSGLAIAVCVILWQTGLGAMLRGLVGWIPQRQRSAAKLLREAVENPEHIREAAAAVRTADPLINAAWKGMTMLASIESLLGSVWFALLLGVVGYVCGQLFPVFKRMSGARCCCTPGEPSCCEQAGLSWWNRYCLYLNPSTYYLLLCDCGNCDNQATGCEECTDGGYFCCRESEFNFCVRGALFRRPYTEGFCGPSQSDTTYQTCPDPWVATDWGVAEGGINSYYLSPVDDPVVPPGCDLCSVAPVAARIRYHCHYRLENYAGNECTFQFEGNTYPLEEFDEVYVVEGKATLYCANPPGECEVLCSCDEATTLPSPLHILKIEPCGTPAAGLPSPPTLTYYTQLDNKTPPHLATWTLGRIDNFGASNYCDLIPPNGTAPNWCASPEVGQGCDDYTSGESWSMGTLNWYPYPCQDQDCTLP